MPLHKKLLFPPKDEKMLELMEKYQGFIKQNHKNGKSYLQRKTIN